MVLNAELKSIKKIQAYLPTVSMCSNSLCRRHATASSVPDISVQIAYDIGGPVGIYIILIPLRFTPLIHRCSALSVLATPTYDTHHHNGLTYSQTVA